MKEINLKNLQLRNHSRPYWQESKGAVLRPDTKGFTIRSFGSAIASPKFIHTDSCDVGLQIPAPTSNFGVRPAFLPLPDGRQAPPHKLHRLANPRPHFGFSDSYRSRRVACAMLRIAKPIHANSWKCEVSPVLQGFLFMVCAILTFSCTNSSSSAEGNASQVAVPEITLELNPSENNPRNSEGDFVTLNDRTVMFVYSKYVGESSSDHAPANLAARYSSDGGVTWTSEDKIIVPNEGGMNVMSVTLLRLQNGDIGLFYLRKNSTEDCIPMLRISHDEAKTWSEAIPCITDKEGYFVLNNARVIQLKDGRLMLAVARHNTPGGEWKGQADLFAYYSDDNGQTWSSSSQVPNNTDIVTQEPGLIEMKDGRVMMYIRASGGFQQLSYSSDRGETWSAIETSNIPSPLSPATIEPVPSTGDWLLVWNNNDGSNPDLKGKRTPITTAISSDEGKTWKYIKNIEEDPDGWYCYIAIHFVDDENILLGYCAGNRPAGTGLSVTHVTRLTKDWLYQD